ncbi:sigma-70 family RNA polymerase sigma factor [Streptomyces narbonensis]|uniref:Sigma-70 family RNA polymerase sigma factor n=1 Tax=Streptomyces narbonensis TaxID=67333 RepID=A0ABV3CDR6_9ACTN
MTTTDTTAKTPLLTDAQRRAVAPLVYGGTNESIGAEIHLSAEGVASHLRTARNALGRRGCSRPVLVHALLAAREVRPPAKRPCPDFTVRDLQLLQALAEHSRNEDIGRAINVPGSDVRTEIDALVAKAGADNAVHLVGLGHAWDILGESAPSGVGSQLEPAESTAGAA